MYQLLTTPLAANVFLQSSELLARFASSAVDSLPAAFRSGPLTSQWALNSAIDNLLARKAVDISRRERVAGNGPAPAGALHPAFLSALVAR